MALGSCLTVRECLWKGPEELLFLEMISHVLGAIAFDDVSSIFRTRTDLESAAVQCYQEFL